MTRPSAVHISACDRQRDRLPLPFFGISDVARKRLSRGVRQRVQKTRAILLRSNLVISSLNSLGGCVSPHAGSISQAQHRSMRYIFDTISEFNVQPSTSVVATHEALRALLGVSHPYSNEESAWLSRTNLVVCRFLQSVHSPYRC